MRKAGRALDAYRAKRSASRTPEPWGAELPTHGIGGSGEQVQDRLGLSVEE